MVFEFKNTKRTKYYLTACLGAPNTSVTLSDKFCADIGESYQKNLTIQLANDEQKSKEETTSIVAMDVSSEQTKDAPKIEVKPKRILIAKRKNPKPKN